MDTLLSCHGICRLYMRGGDSIEFHSWQKFQDNGTRYFYMQPTAHSSLKIFPPFRISYFRLFIIIAPNSLFLLWSLLLRRLLSSLIPSLRSSTSTKLIPRGPLRLIRPLRTRRIERRYLSDTGKEVPKHNNNTRPKNGRGG